MSTLEVLLEAERTLMDENEPYDHGDWDSCTCGHIYHAVEGNYSSTAAVSYDPGDYRGVLLDLIKVLGLEDKDESPNKVISDYVEIVALGETIAAPAMDDYALVKREHALKVIREAIAAIRKRDDEAMLKVIDSHTYGIST